MSLLVVAAVVAAASPGGGHASAAHANVVPPVETRRIAARYTGAHSYLPVWAPPGVAFSRWTVVWDSGAGNDRLVVHFVSGAGGLDWEVFWSGDRVRSRLGCRDATVTARIVDARRVFYRTARHSASAWFCTRANGFPQTISVTSRGWSAGRQQLERMVASARRLPPGRALGSSYELVPAAEARRIAAAFGQPLVLPTTLPSGFIFIGSKVDRHGSVWVTFGRDGLLLEWSVQAGAEKEFACPPAEPSTLIQGRRISHIVAIHGGSAWTCFAAESIGNTRPLEVGLWYDIRLDRPAFRRHVMRIVATAKPVRNR